MSIRREMSRICLVAAAVLAMAPAAAEASSAQFHVAGWGRDSWPGTYERPFATIERAQRAVRARTSRMASDVVVNLRGGVHRLAAPLALSTGDSGRNGYRVVYQAYGHGTPKQEQVTVSGGREVAGWRPDPRLKGVWSADVGGLDTRQLYVDGARAPRAALGAGLPGKVEQTADGYVTDSTVPQSWHDPGGIEFAYTLPIYSDGRCGVAGIAGDARHTRITMDQPCWRLALALYEEPFPGEEPEQLGGPTNIEGSTSFLRTPGSWHLDKSRPGHHVLRYLPHQGEDPRRALVVAPVLETLVRGTGVHDVTFRGLTFADATWLAPSEPAGFVSAWSMYKRPGVQTWLTVPGNVAFHASDRIALTGNRFTRLGAQALEISRSSSHNVVEGNVFTDISDGAILLGVPLPDTGGRNRGNRVGNNWIHHIGVENRGASGIWNIGTEDTVIAHNQINDVPYMGLLSGRDPDLPGLTRRNRIVGNRLFDTMRVMGDGGGIYLRGEQGTSYADGTVLTGNVVTGGRLEQESIFNAGIYTDDTTSWVTVRGNVSHGYLAAIGGCDEPERPVDHVRYLRNFWDDAVPEWVERRDFAGAWPCQDPHNLTFERNTLLAPEDPAQACDADPACAAIVARAGLEPQYRGLLRTR